MGIGYRAPKCFVLRHPHRGAGHQVPDVSALPLVAVAITSSKLGEARTPREHKVLQISSRSPNWIPSIGLVYHLDLHGSPHNLEGCGAGIAHSRGCLQRAKIKQNRLKAPRHNYNSLSFLGSITPGKGVVESHNTESQNGAQSLSCFQLRQL